MRISPKLFFLAAALPLVMRAQNGPADTLTLTAVAPEITLDKGRSDTTNVSLSATPGSVKFTIPTFTGDRTGTISVTGPPNITGVDSVDNYKLSSTTNFGLSMSLTGFSISQAWLGPAINGQLPSEPGYCEVNNTPQGGTANCPVQQIYKLTTSAGKPAVGLQLYAHLTFVVQGESFEVDLTGFFEWTTFSGCLISPSAISAIVKSGFAPHDTISCTDDLAVDSIAVVQAMQTAKNEVKLIQGKDTWVRVFVKSVGANARPLSPIGGVLTVNGTTYTPDDHLTVRADPNTVEYGHISITNPADRLQIPTGFVYNALDFHLGKVFDNQLDIKAQVWVPDDQGKPQTEANQNNNLLLATLPVEPQGAANPFIVGLGSICISGPTKVITCPPRFSKLYIDPSFPLREIRPVQVFLPKLVFDLALFTTPDGVALATITMLKEYQRAVALSNTLDYFKYPESDQVIFTLGASGVSADDYYGVPGGIGGRFWWVSNGCFYDPIPCANAFEIAHGIGHNYGLAHVKYDQPSPLGTLSPTQTMRRSVKEIFHYYDALWLSANGDLMVTGSFREKDYFPNGFLDVGGTEYNALHAAFQKGFTPAAVPRPRATSAETAVVSGFISTGGASGSLDPAFHGPSNVSPAPSNSSGDTCLRFTPAGASSDYCFKVQFATGATKGYFAVAAPYPTGTTRVALMRNGTELASIGAGTAPQLSFTSPAAGQSWQGVQTIRWSSSGATNPVYRLEYSPDNGTSWLPLSGDLTATQYDFDTSDILGGSIMFRVTATSGLTNSSAISPAVKIVQNPQMTLPATTVTFKNLQIGASDDQDVVINNSGTGQLMVQLVKPTNAAFELLSPTTLMIAGGTSASVNIRFTPTAAGQQQGTLQVGNQTVTLRGSGFSSPVPNIQIASPLDLGEVQAGQKKDSVFTIFNTGGNDLKISALSVSGAGFTLANPGTPLTIAPANSASFTTHIASGSAGTQTGQLNVTSNDPSRGQLQTPVTVRVDTTAVPVSSAAGVLNAAGYQGGAVAPGEIVVIFGSTIGPPAIAGLQLDSTGLVASTVSDTRVFFDEFAAPIIYTLAGQTSVVVPYEIAGRVVTSMVVEYQGRRSDPVSLAVTDTIPALFSANSSGTGQGAILNQDYSINSVQNPAKKGDYVILFGTGEGATNPNVVDGSVTAAAVKPLLPVTTTIGGVPQTVLYGGAAPSLVAGVLQVNVQIAPNTPSGNQPVVVTVGTVSTQTGLTVAIAGAATPVPAISVSSDSLDFGTVTTGQTKDMQVTVRNTGSATLTVSSLTSSNARFASTTPAAPFSVAAGGSQVITIRFSPNAAGAQSGKLTIASNDPFSPSAIVNLTGSGVAAAVPTIGVTPTSLDFGAVTIGQTKDLPLTVRNTGSAALTVSSLTSSNARFVATTPTVPFSVAAGASQVVTIRFSPTATGTQSGNFTIGSNDPASPTLPLTVSGSGISASTPAITTSAARLDFGSVTIGKPQSMSLTIGNAGSATLSVSSIVSDNKLFTPSATSTSLPAGAQISLSVQFAPTAAGLQSGTLTIASSDPAHPSVVIPLTATGVTAGPASITLSVDGGTFNNSIGVPNVANAIFVNRLTPPSYPATISAVQVFFGNRSTGLAAGTPITLVVATNPSGSSTFSAASAGLLNLYTSSVAAVGAFNAFTLPAPITITSGDFVVGFSVPNPAGLFPADEDRVTNSQGRSYVSSDGFNFSVIDTFGASLAGNFGIRAIVTLGGSTQGSALVTSPHPSIQPR